MLAVTVLVYFYIAGVNNGGELSNYHSDDEKSKDDHDFLANVTLTETSRVVRFGRGNGARGRDSRHWDRDGDYTEDVVEKNGNDSLERVRSSMNVDNKNEEASHDSVRDSYQKGVGLYNEAGRQELEKFEAEYEASLKNVGESLEGNGNENKLSEKTRLGMHDEEDYADDLYDGIDVDDFRIEEYNNSVHGKGNLDESESHVVKVSGEDAVSQHIGTTPSKSSQSGSRRKPRAHRFSGSSCEMKLLNSTVQLVEPSESKKFARFSLQYTEVEDKPEAEELRDPRFAGHQTLQEREQSFLAQDQKINCGFVKGPKGYPSTGFDLAEDDVNYE